MADKVVRKQAYGQELILDLHGCDANRFTRSAIERFCEELCELIDMERCDLHFWDDVGVPEGERQNSPKTKGTSAVQFILTSTIVQRWYLRVGQLAPCVRNLQSSKIRQMGRKASNP